MLESDATDKEQQAPLAQEPWHDKILGDAIGHTKGLVTILDSLSEGFRRRGQELEELRPRLAILQSERRTLQEERAGLQAQIGTLAAECEALRQELTQGRTALEARAQEIQALNVACEDAKRQADELREIVRSLERQLGQGRPSTVQHLPGPWPPEGAAAVDLPGASRREVGEPSQPLVAVAGPAKLQLHSLTTERDRLQAELEKRDQELDRLRQELAQGQASLEARVRELQEHQRAAAEGVRQKDHLQEVVRGLEREKESAAQRDAARITEIEGELARMREAVSSALPLPSMFPQVDMEEEMVRLHQNLDTLLPDTKKRIVQFIGSREGEGTSTVVREFARVSATRFGKRVLLLDADRSAPGKDPLLAMSPDNRGAGAHEGEDPTEVAPYQIGNSGLFIGAIPQASGSALQDGNSPRTEAFWERLRQRFDLVLVDSQPAAKSADGLSISSKVDGVILVVEAETTRWPVVESVRDSIARSGGKVLGIVFNKRRHYIPRFIYTRL